MSSSLGIYFGPKSISIVESKGKKVIHNIQIPQTTISTDELGAKVPAEVKLVEIIALIKDELRRNKIESKEVALCLSGKDLIIRTFELPVLAREELHSAINFEAKKYIPFKVEDLITDFQVKLDKSSNTNLVLFMGIQKETFDKYISVLSQLDIKMSSIEYSAFSALRSLGLAKLSERGVVAFLGIDIAGEDEINFAVLEDGFPLFSRDIALSAGPERLVHADETEDSGQTLEKLKTEIRVSLDYYHRKFPTKNIKKIYLLCDQDYRTDLEAFMSEIGLSVSFADVAKYIDKTAPYSLSSIKGFSASLSRAVKSDVRVDLLGAKEKAKPAKEKDIQTEASSLLKGIRLDYRFVSISVLICIAAFAYGFYRMTPLRKALGDILAVRPQVSSVKPDVSYNELMDMDSMYTRKLASLDNLIKKQLYLNVPLDAIPRTLPKGAWLKSFSFSKQEGGSSELTLEGMVYLGDSNREYDAVNKFLSNLKENSGFNKYFTEINIVSLSRGQLGTLTTTNFTISCKNYKGAS